MTALVWAVNISISRSSGFWSSLRPQINQPACHHAVRMGHLVHVLSVTSYCSIQKSYFPVDARVCFAEHASVWFNGGWE